MRVPRRGRRPRTRRRADDAGAAGVEPSESSPMRRDAADVVVRRHGSRVSSPDPSLRSSTSVMDKAERDAILRQGVVLPGDAAPAPRARRARRGSRDDPADGQAAARCGRALFRPSAEAYLVATRGPLPYMLRLREIEQLDGDARGAAGRGLARSRRGAATADSGALPRRDWPRGRGAYVFDEVNDLIDRHNRWYPAESRLPMDPRRGDYALVERSRLPPRAARRRLGPRAFPGRAQLGARSPCPDERVDRVALLAVRRRGARARAFTISRPGSSAMRSRRACRGCPGRSDHRRHPSGSCGRGRRSTNVPPGASAAAGIREHLRALVRRDVEIEDQHEVECASLRARTRRGPRTRNRPRRRRARHARAPWRSRPRRSPRR